MSSKSPLMNPFPTSESRVLRVVAFGTLDVVNNYVMTQYQLGFAEISEWSRPLPSSNPKEVMRILTKRIN